MMSCKLFTQVFSTPVGTLEAVGCCGGLHKLTITQSAHLTIESRNTTKVVVTKRGEKADVKASAVLNSCEQWLRAYFKHSSNDLSHVKPRLCPSVFNNDSFQSRIWCTLEKQIPYGKTVSYGELAKLAGSPGASQAVGTAMKKNPVCLIVPCHRVVRASGNPGNYAGGKLNDTKQWLLQLEQTN